MDKFAARKEFLRYVSFNMLGSIGVNCYILADTYFIAQGMGSDGIAALNLVIPIYCFVVSVGLMLGIGGATRYSIFLAQKREEEASKVFTTCMAVGAVVGIFFALLLTQKADLFVRWLGADEAIYEITYTYFYTLCIFSPFFLLNRVLNVFVRNDKSPKIAMVAMVVGSLFNIVFDYIFIFPMGLGMFGAALATGVSPTVSMLVLSLHFKKPEHQLRFSRKLLRVSELLQTAALGLSGFINEIASGLVILVFNFVILAIEGNVGVAAYGVIANLAIVVIGLCNGLADGIQPLISKSYGEGRTPQVAQFVRYGLCAALMLAMAAYIFGVWQSDWLISMFNREQDLMLHTMAKEGIHLYFIGFFFAAINLVMMVSYSATERPLPAFLISITRGFLAILPAVICLAHWLGMKGVWLSYPVAEAIAALVLLCVFGHDKIKSRG